MNITCPHCQYAKSVDPAKVPDRLVKVSCPKCNQGFTFQKPVQSAGKPADQATTAPPVQRTCPACGLTQEDNDRCTKCGVIYTKVQERQQDKGAAASYVDTMHENLSTLRQKAAEKPLEYQPKAGFWIRVVAYLIDSVLLGVVQLVLSIVITLLIGVMGIATEGDPAINTVIWLFGAAISIGYAVFFVGYCGQTPGKMALRIRVIRTDGSQISYGRAALREVLGKFVSGILLGIGYIMVAFDSQKQGLHDKIADTYVIKL